MGAKISSFFKRLFGAKPDPCNITNSEIQRHIEMERQARAEEEAEAELADLKTRIKKLEETLKDLEAREREEGSQKRQEAKRTAQQAGRDATPAKQKGEKLETGEKEAMEKEVKAKRISEELRQVALGVEGRQEEVNTRASSHQREADTWMVADTYSQLEQARRCLELVPFCREGLGGSIQPEVWPTEEEFQLAKKRIQYDPEKIHFAVCGSSGSGKSSLVNSFCGLKSNSPHAARTGVVETTKDITRYPDPRKEMPYNRLVWFDCPGAGTLKVPGWQYFNQQGLFIFDVIVLVYDTRFTEIDVSIIRNCEGFKIPLFIVRSKADIHIPNIMKSLGYDEDDDDAEIKQEEYQEKARRLLIDKTTQNVKENLEEAGLSMHDIFIVSDSAVFSLVAMKPNKKKPPPMIDEARLVESVLKAAYERRYFTHVPLQSSWDIINRGRNMISVPLPSMLKRPAERFMKNMITNLPLTLTGLRSSEEEQSSEEGYMVTGPSLLVP